MMQEKDFAYMKIALSEAEKAFEKDEVPVGSVIVNNGSIVARAHNQIKLLKDPTAHAEMIAITQAASSLKNERLNGCELYVTIEPCVMCVGAMILGRVQRVVYGADDPKTGACGSVVDLTEEGLFNHALRVTKGVEEEACRDIIQRFFRAKRK